MVMGLVSFKSLVHYIVVSTVVLKLVKMHGALKLVTTLWLQNTKTANPKHSNSQICKYLKSKPAAIQQEGLLW